MSRWACFRQRVTGRSPFRPRRHSDLCKCCRCLPSPRCRIPHRPPNRRPCRRSHSPHRSNSPRPCAGASPVGTPSAKPACRSAFLRRIRTTAATANESGAGTTVEHPFLGTVRPRWLGSRSAADRTTVQQTASAACTRSDRPKCRPPFATQASVSVVSLSNCATRTLPKAVACRGPGATGGGAYRLGMSRIEYAVHGGGPAVQTVAFQSPTFPSVHRGDTEMLRRGTPAALVFVLLQASCGGDDSSGSPDGGTVQCPKGQVSCNGDCVDLASDPDHCGACGLVCNSSEVCSAGSCSLSCQAGLTNCDRACVSLRGDRDHCGGCGQTCPSGNVCSDGVCAVSCQEQLTECDGSCVNAAKDRLNCGGCGVVCAPGELCSNGTCGVSCQQGLTECDGVCENLLTSVESCGACGVACGAGQVCSLGTCALSCQSDLTTCNGICVNPLTDNSHCGSCSVRCAPGTLCSQGTCSVSCQTELTECNGTCVNPETDNAHCGQCGNVCAPGKVCTDGECKLSCLQGLTDCEGICVNLQTDRANCGACGIACESGELCSEGSCSVTCQSGLTNCNEVCVNLKTDNAHCGQCEHACSSGYACSAGSCSLTCLDGLTNCDGTCADLDADLAHCGSCGNACGAGTVCNNGACAASCQAPQVACGSTCTNTSIDPNHCGGCAGSGGTVCTAGPNQDAVCVDGSCREICEAGYVDCDGNATNGCELTEASMQTDLFHCGACDISCWGSEEVCVTGQCMPAQAESCLATGGTITTVSCCTSAGSFPATCSAGACGCGPSGSQPTLFCQCPSGMCFNGWDCVPQQQP